MAFKKTGGRSALVQPTGLPNFSGFKQAAASYNQIGELAYGIGLDDRKREFNQLIRQAEIDGKTAGVVYDEKGDLVPLTNFDYEKASQTFAESDQKQILATYRKAAVQTYVNAAANDINSAAAQALIDNPSDPGAIRSSAQGYLSGIQDLDEEIYTALAPKVASAFTRVENQALAQQRSDEIAYAVDQGKQAYNQNAIELGVLYAKSEGTNNPAQAKALQDRINEILGEQADIIMGLEANEVSSITIDEMQDAQATVIAAKVSQSGVERAYYSGGAAEAYRLIKDTVAEAELNPDIDSATLRAVMTQSVQTLSAIETAESQAQKEVMSGIYNDLYRRIVIDGLDITAELADPTSPIHGLPGTQQATLFTVGTSLSEQVDESKLKGYKSQYSNYLSILENPEQTTATMAMEAMREIRLLHGMGLLGDEDDKLLIEAQAKYDEAMGVFIGRDNEKLGSTLSMELNPNLSSFSKSPAYYLNEMYMSDLEGKKVIGEGRYWSDRDAFIAGVGTYAAAYKKRVDLARLAGTAERKILNTIMPSTTELKAFSQVKGFDKVRNLQTGEIVPMDLLSEDENIFMASVDNVAAFAVQSKGLLHPSSVDLFESASKNVANADRAIRVMGQAMDAIRSARDIDNEQVEGIFYSNFSDETVAFLRLLSRTDPQIAVESFAAQANMNRNASSLVAGSKYADLSESEALEKIFMDAYEEAIKAKSVLQLMKPYITNRDNQMLYQMANKAGTMNVEGMVLSDPYIKGAMKSMFVSTMLKYPQSVPAEVVRDVLWKLGTRVGPQVNAYTGGLEFVTNPILPNAQATVGNADVTISMKTINQDIKDIFLNKPGLIDDKIAEQLRRVDEAPMIGGGTAALIPFSGFSPDRFTGSSLFYVANENYGAEQSYTVLLKTSQGKVIPLLDNYRYDFKRSESYESFLKSVDLLKTDRMKNFWSVYGLMDQSLLQSGFDSIERTRSDSSFDALFNLYNRTFRADIGEEPVSPEEKDDFFYMLDRITSLGWR